MRGEGEQPGVDCKEERLQRDEMSQSEHLSGCIRGSEQGVDKLLAVSILPRVRASD
jgi:hypothetical protein